MTLKRILVFFKKLFLLLLHNQILNLLCCVCVCVCLVTQSCPILWDPMDCSLPGSSVQGISQARILEWVAISFFRGCTRPRDGTRISCTDRWILYCWASQSVHDNQQWVPSGMTSFRKPFLTSHFDLGEHLDLTLIRFLNKWIWTTNWLW